MKKRWPTLLALLTAAPGLFAVFADGGQGFDAPVAVMTLIYLMTFAWGKPVMAWVAFPISSVLLVVLAVLDGPVSVVNGLLMAMVLAWLAAIVAGRVKEGKWFTIQTAGMVLFGAIALAATAADAKLGAVLAGLGFLAHGAWDAYHYWQDRVVARSYAEYCGVVDLIIGLALPIAAFTV